VRREHGRPAKADATRLRALASFTGALADQLALKFGDRRQQRREQSAGWRRGVEQRIAK
jgi:hypothetical protein